MNYDKIREIISENGYDIFDRSNKVYRSELDYKEFKYKEYDTIKFKNRWLFSRNNPSLNYIYIEDKENKYFVFKLYYKRDILGFVVRDYNTGSYRIIKNYKYPYNIYLSSRFIDILESEEKLDMNYPIVFVEGVLDCEAVSEIYPLVVAYLGKFMSKNVIELFKRISRKLIMIPDSDAIDYVIKEKGRTIKRHNIEVIKLPRWIKDPFLLINYSKGQEIKRNEISSIIMSLEYLNMYMDKGKK